MFGEVHSGRELTALGAPGEPVPLLLAATPREMQPERALDELRWRLADELRVNDPDGFAALVARAVQLRLAWRRAGWDEDAGWRVLEAAQRRIEERHG